MKEKTGRAKKKNLTPAYLAGRPLTKGVKLETVEKDSDKLKKDCFAGKYLYESILDGITSGVWATDKNDVIHYANKAMEMIAGVTQQKLWGYRALKDSSENTIDHFRRHYAD